MSAFFALGVVHIGPMRARCLWSSKLPDPTVALANCMQEREERCGLVTAQRR